MGDEVYEDMDQEYASTFGYWNTPLLSSEYKHYVIGVMVVSFVTLMYALYSYGSMAKAASAVHKKTIGKLTQSPVPLDWREVEVEDLAPAEVERVRSFALAQAVFDTVTATVILICGLYLLSVLSKHGALAKASGFAGAGLDAGSVATGFLTTNWGLLFLVLLVLASAIYAMWHVFTLAGRHRLPFYMRWWYGQEYEWFAPANMFGILFVVGGLVALGANASPEQQKDAMGRIDVRGQLEGDSTAAKIKMYSVLFCVFYMIYSFYGAYLVHMAKTSERMEPYLDFLYPFVTSVIIAKLAADISGESRTGIAAFVICAGLIAFRAFGRKASDHWILNDFEFWTKIVTYVFIFAVVVIAVMVGTGKTSLLASVSKKGGLVITERGVAIGKQLGVMTTDPQTMLLAAMLGGFFFFSLQLFWTTTIMLADLGLALASMTVILLFAEEAKKYMKDIQGAMLSGFLVTGVLWMGVVQKEGFKALVENS